MKSTIATALLATAALAASAGANAFTSTPYAAGVPAAGAHAVHVQAQVFHGPSVQTAHLPMQQVYVHPESREPRYRERRHARSACGAPRWDPSVRYMPGQVVWRHGELFVARRISARVWNENSPPEWTPNYWAPAVCG